jgi:hypothetical protein
VHQTIINIQEYVHQNALGRLAAWYTLYGSQKARGVLELILHARYFLFHAALIHAVCLCVEPDAQNANDWRADLDASRSPLSTSFGDNPMAARSLRVLDRVIPAKIPLEDDLPPSFFESSMMDFSLWNMDTNEPLDDFGWPDHHNHQ